MMPSAQVVSYELIMKEALQYIYSICGYESHIRVDTHELWFRMPQEYWFVISLCDLHCLADEDSEDSIPFDVDEIEKDKIANIKTTDILSINLCISESIEDECYIPTKPYTYIAESINKKLCIAFPNAVLSYATKEYCIYEEFLGCPEVSEYGSIFDIDVSQFTLKFVLYIDNLFTHTHSIGIPSFYNLNRKPKDNYNIRVLPSNTKVRRLGYLKLLLSMFNNVDKIPISIIASKFEFLSTQYKEYLHNYKNNKGEIIITKTGVSAKPYIDLAEKLGLINKIAGYYTLAKEGKIYNSLIKETEIIRENVFSINNVDIPYLLELILKEDFLYILTILRLIYKETRISYDKIRTIMQIELLNRCNLCSLSEDISFSGRLSIRTQILKIKEWKESLTYLEHIIMPRINWLYDMDIITMDNNSFCLTSRGRRLYCNLTIWDDIKMDKVVSPQWYIDNFFMKMYDITTDCHGEKFDIVLHRNLMQKYIDDAFKLFKTIAPNRVAFSQLAKYVKYKLYMNHNLLIDTDDIKELFSNLEFVQYIFMYQNQYNDGYIQKR